MAGVAKRLKNQAAIKKYISNQGKVIDGYEFKEFLSELGYKKPRDIVKGLEEGGMFAEDILGNKTITKTERPSRLGEKFSKGQMTTLNKYAELLNKQQPDKYTSSNWMTLGKSERVNILQRARDNDWKFKATTQWDPLTLKQQQKIIDVFDLPEDAFKRMEGLQKNIKDVSGKYGVTRYLKTGEKNPLYDQIYRYVKNGFKFPPKDTLPVGKQREIMAKFELPEGFEKWDFEKYKYGVPSGGSATNPAYTKRIIDFTKGKTRYPNLAADPGTPQGWMMHQMNRTYEFEKGKVPKNKLTYQPIFETINNKQKIIGFIDNTPSGKGDTYFSIKKWLNRYGGTSLASHDDFKNVKKFVDIANRAFAEPNEVITGLLKKGGIESTGKLQLKHVLNYLAETQGYKPTEKAVILHHQAGVGAKGIPGQATRDLQLLRSTTNSSIMQAENRIRTAVSNNITPNVDDINKLKNLGASVKVGGQTFGAGSQTAIGGWKAIEKEAETSIRGWGKADFKKFKTYVEELGCGKAAGGRASFKDGSTCYTRGIDKIQTGKITTPGERANFTKLAQTLGPDGWKFVGIDYDAAIKTKGPVASILRKVAETSSRISPTVGKVKLDPIKAIRKGGKWLFGPVEMGLLPVALAADALYQNYANKRDLKKALDQAPSSGKHGIPQYMKNLILEGYRQESRDIGGVGLESYAIDQPNISGALEKIGYGDRTELRQRAGMAIADVRAQEQAARTAELERQRKIFDPYAPMAGGGIAGIRRPWAIPPESGPDPQGLASINNYATKLTE